jgi:hypothetical protein
MRPRGRSLSKKRGRKSAVNRRDCVRFGAAAFGAGLFPGGPARAQSKYPQTTIRLVVPYAPGGVVDAVARNWVKR